MRRGGARSWLAAAALLMVVHGCGEPKGDGVRGTDVAPATSTGGDELPGQPLAIPLPEAEVRDLEGRERSIRAAGEGVTVLNFWATWCVPCLEEIPELVALQDSLGGRGVRVVGIAIDSGEPEDIRRFARKHAMDYPLLQASSGWARRHFAVFGLPVTLVVDGEDVIRRRFVGPHTYETFRAAALESLGGRVEDARVEEGGVDE